MLPLRELDKLGVYALNVDPENALSHAVRLSVEHWIWCEADEPIAAAGYGAHGLVGTTAYGWLLSSSRSAQLPLHFARESVRAVAHMMRLFPRVEVTCLHTHTTSRRWLDWLGFAPCEETPHFSILEKVR